MVVDDDEAMLATANAPLAQWRVFLHLTQNKLARVTAVVLCGLGGAGTGKTVSRCTARNGWRRTALWRQEGALQYLHTQPRARYRREPEDASSADAMSRIEVKNLDAWWVASCVPAS